MGARLVTLTTDNLAWPTEALTIRTDSLRFAFAFIF